MIVVAGEALVDMVAKDMRPPQPVLTAAPGGSAFNVACALGLLACQTGFICPLSQDSLGQLLCRRLEQCGVKALLQPAVSAATPLALVTVDHNNQAHYSFYREGTADRLIGDFALESALPKETTLLHITGFCLNEADDYQHWITLINAAKQQGAIISVDPNVRANLVSDPEDYRRRINDLINLADIVKVSDEDLLYLAEQQSIEDASQQLAARVKLAIITYGADGARAFYQQQSIAVPANSIDHLVDTIGAGDCFAAAYLYGVQQAIDATKDINTLKAKDLQKILKFAAQAAAINCTRQGCQPPTLAELLGDER